MKRLITFAVTLILLLTSVVCTPLQAGAVTLLVINENCDVITGFGLTGTITSDYENGSSGNRVMKINNVLADASALYKRQYDIGKTRSQKWTIRVKLGSVDSSETAALKLFSFSPSGAGSSLKASYVVLKGDQVYIYNAATPNDLQSILDTGKELQANRWYTIVRLMDFNIPETNMSKVYVYDDASVPLAETNWYESGQQGPKSSGEPAYSTMIYAESGAFAGNIMLDDYTASDIAPKIIKSSSNNATNKFVGFETYIGTNSSRNLGRLITNQGTNIKVNDVTYKKQIWEAKFNLPNLTAMDPNNDPNNSYTNIFNYDSGSGGVNPTKYKPVVIRGYDARIIVGGTTNEVSILNSGQTLQPGKWYKVKRYMDFTAADPNNFTSSVYIYDDTNTLIGSRESYFPGNFLATGQPTPKYINIEPWRYPPTQSILLDDIKYYPDYTPTGSDTITSFTYDFENYNYGDTIHTTTQNDKLYTNDTAIAQGVIQSEGFATNYFNMSNNSTELNVVFDAPIKTSTVNTDTIILKMNGNIISGHHSVTTPVQDGNACIVNVTGLEYGANYTMDFSSGIKDTIWGAPIGTRTYAVTTKTDPLVVSTMQVRNSGDTPITTTLSKDTVIKGYVSIANSETSPKDYMIILAIYKDGALKNVTAKAGQIASGTVNDSTDLLTILEDGCTASVMLWDNWDNMRPIRQKVSVPQ